MNDGTTTRLEKWRGIYSCIDLTLVTPKLSESLARGILEDKNFWLWSLPTIYNFENNKILIIKLNTNMKKANFSAFQSLNRQIKFEDVFSGDTGTL
jgi:hypothetical protein